MLVDNDADLRRKANTLSDELDSDIILINSPIYPPLDVNIASVINNRQRKKSNAIVIIVTEGGVGDVAFRSARHLQSNFKRVTAVVPGWCKSAGTLLCVGAHELIFGRHGELGPIDVQLRRADEIGERESGLAISSAFDGLSEAAFRMFEQFMLGIKTSSGGSVTFKTAADIAAQMTVGMISPVFAQLDPIKIGEIQRSVRVAEQYAKRLAVVSRNILIDDSFDGIDFLVRGFPSHGFAIDFWEAHMIFRNVRPATGALDDLLCSLGDIATRPISGDEQTPGARAVTEFLNDEENGAGAGTGESEGADSPNEQDGSPTHNDNPA